MKTPYRILFGAALLLPALALAHVGADAGVHHEAGFLAGFTHPFGGLDHLAAMLAVGLWSALASLRPGWRMIVAPTSFAGVLLLGALLGAAGLSLPVVEPMIAVSLLVLGLLILTQIRLPLAAGAALVGGFALFHGVAHGQELGSGGAFAGMVLATALLHTAGLALGLQFRSRSHWLNRAAGALVGAFGLALLLG